MGLLFTPMAKYGKIREAKVEFVKFSDALRGITNLSPSQSLFLARLPRWNKIWRLINDNENGKQAKGSYKQNNFARVSRFFVHFLAVVARLQRETSQFHVLWRMSRAIPHLFERLFLISRENNRDCHITMPLSLKTMEVQIKGDQWNKKFRTAQVYWMSRAQHKIFKVTVRIRKKVRAPMALQILKPCSLRKFFNWGSQRCHFLRSPQDISSKENTKENAVVSCLFYTSQGLSVLIQCSRGRRKVKQRRHQEVETSVTTATNINVLVLV